MKISEAFEQFDALRVANALGLEYDTVCKWRDRESIPAYWRVKFVNLMNHHGVSISLHDLAGWIKLALLSVRLFWTGYFSGAMMNKRMNPFNGNGGHNCNLESFIIMLILLVFIFCCVG